jgi:hypothetical protein
LVLAPPIPCERFGDNSRAGRSAVLADGSYVNS